jgi:glutathione S-transferase
MEKEFGAIHQDQLKEPIQRGGYPDTGSGRYSQKLSYKDWYTFNILQRVHLSYLEQLPIALTALASAGVYRPRLASIMGAILIVGK